MIEARANSWIWLLGLALAVPIEAAWAQAQKASLAVRVTSKATGQPIRNSLCVAESNLDTGSSAIKLTNTSGVCEFPVLRPGIYTLRVDARDFKPEAVARVVVGSSGVEVKVALEPFKTSGPAAIECKKKLEEADIVALLKGGVHEGRVLEFVRSCGVSFALDAPLEQRLRAAGATEVLVDWLRPPKPTPTQTSGQQPNVWALIVGVSWFRNLKPDDQLQFAAKDAEAFARFITSQRGGGVPRENVMLLLNAEASMASIKNGLAVWLVRKARPGDTVYIFLATHSMVEPLEPKETYFLGSDSDPNNLYAGALSIDELDILISRRLARVGRILLLADLDRSGNAGRGIHRSLAQAVGKNSELIGLLASRPGENSQEGPQFCGGHGAFTCFLLKGLDGAADADRDNIVNVTELVRYAGDQLSKATAGKQHLREFGNFDGDVPLAFINKPGPADWKAFAPGPK